MVSSKPERKTRPEYSLDRIRELARSAQVAYGSRRVEMDCQNLGYGPEDICECIASLEAQDFRGAVRYEHRPFWMDEYRIRWRSAAGASDTLYLKLHLNRDMIIVTLDSFHRNR